MAGHAFNFCPYCGTLLHNQVRHGAWRPVCSACGFVQFHDPKVAVGALVTRDEAVLLVRRGVPPGKGQWALPGGFMDAGEAPETALGRELLEEAGLAVQVGPLLAVHPLEVGEARLGIVLVYAANVIGEGGVLPVAGDDVTEAGWFRHDALPTALAFDSTRTLLAQWAARFT